VNKATFGFHGKELQIESPDAQMLAASIWRFAAPNFFENISVIGLPPVDRIVDIGACIGSYSLLFHEIWPDAEIWAIEPSSRNFDYLVRNTSHIPNIHHLQLAIGEAEYKHTIAIPTLEQKTHMNYGDGNCGIMSLFGESDLFREEVQVCKLDDIIDWCNFIKIDTEGYEYRVIQGASRILDTCRPSILMECEGPNMKMAHIEVDDLFRLLFSHGYVALNMKIHNDVPLLPKEKVRR